MQRNMDAQHFRVSLCIFAVHMWGFPFFFRLSHTGLTKCCLVDSGCNTLISFRNNLIFSIALDALCDILDSLCPDDIAIFYDWVIIALFHSFIIYYSKGCDCTHSPFYEQ